MDNPTSYRRHMNTRQIALLSILTALSVAIQLAPRLPNIESTSLISFTVGVVFGSLTGAFLGALVMFANGYLSFWGLAGLNMPFQMVGMGMIGLVGGLYGKTIKEIDVVSGKNIVEVVILGAFLTLIYDILTNFGFAVQLSLVTGASLWLAFVGVLITGAVFAFIHVTSNAFLFMIAMPLAKVMRQLTR